LSIETTIKVLLVEDLPQDAELALRTLQKNGLVLESQRVDTTEDFLSALTGFNPDLIISDYHMPSFDGMRALHLAREWNPIIPFIILTGAVNEETAVLCMKAGASDYILKEHLSRLAFAVREALKWYELQKTSTRQEQDLRESELRYRTLFSKSAVSMLIIDPDDAGIVDLNDAAQRFYGYAPADWTGKKVTDLAILDPVAVRARIGEAVAGSNAFTQSVHRRADGSQIAVEVHSSPIEMHGKKYLLSIVHDVSLRVTAEKKRDEVTQKLAHYLTSSPTITYSLGIEDGATHTEWISENVEKILGYTVPEAMAQDWWFANVSAADKAGAVQSFNELLQTGQSVREYRFNTKDRSAVWLRDIMRLQTTEAGNLEVVGTLTDISSLKKTEAELHLAAAALEAAFNAVVITDRGGIIEWANSAFERLTGYRPAEAIGKNPRELIKSGAHDPEYYRALWQTIAAGNVWHGVIVNKKKSGDCYDEEMTITPVLNAAGRIEHYIAIKSDVTERIRTEKNLEASLREKEILLQEIHHRVKNNMQVISSLINMSQENIDDPTVRRTLDSLNRRIQTIAVVHEQFYDSPDMACIDFSDCLRNLVTTLVEDTETPGEKPRLSFALQPTALNLEKAIPAGLIVSELVANSLRFAFQDIALPAILNVRLQLVEPDNRLVIEVRDNGTGLPGNFKPETAYTLGMTLIRTLSSQLRGTTTFRFEEGTVATLSFPAADQRTKE